MHCLPMDAACSRRLAVCGPVPRGLDRCDAAATRGGALRQARRTVRVAGRGEVATAARGAPPAADANELAPPRSNAVGWLARGWGRKAEDDTGAKNGGVGPEAHGGSEARGERKAQASVPAVNGVAARGGGGHQPGGLPPQQHGQHGQQQQPTRGSANNGAQQGKESSSAVQASGPASDWDAGAAARARASLPLFKAQQWWESLFYREDGSPVVPEWRRPPWLPEFLDPLDRKSDMRRWIAPYLIAPWLLAQLLKFSLVGPLLEAELHKPGSTTFHLRGEQLERVEQEAERYRSHLVFEQLLQRQPPMSDGELLGKVKDKLAVDEKEMLERNCQSSTELVTDTTFATIVGLNILVNLNTVRRIQTAVGKEFFSMDSSRQAFMLLLVSDILVGYHSSEGWATALELVADHYGIAERKDLTALFIAVVPVSVDVVFKYWCYSSLRNWSPDTQVILDEIDH